MTWMATDMILFCRRRLLDSSLIMVQRFPGLLGKGLTEVIFACGCLDPIIDRVNCRHPSMRLSILLFVILSIFLIQTWPCIGQPTLSKEDSKGSPIPAIEEYEREKLARLKQNIGRRYLVARTARPVEFYQQPEEQSKSFTLTKEKEGFLITEVVQNRSGIMNFYHVVFDSGETGYLSADGNYLGIKIREGSIIPLSRVSSRRKDPGSSKSSSLKAVELVKKHLIKMDPMSGKKLSVELRMVEAKARSFPNLKWRYEGREIGYLRVRVIQFSEGEGGASILRTWIVDLSKQAVYPENQSAQSFYQ